MPVLIRGGAPWTCSTIPFRGSICLANSPGTLVRLTLHEVAPEAGLAPAPHRLTGERATLTPLWIANWRRGWESRPRRFLGRTWLPTRVLVYAGPPPKYLADKVSDPGGIVTSGNPESFGPQKVAEG